MSIWDDMIDGLYEQFGVAAQLLPGVGGTARAILAIPKIGGVSVDPPGTSVEVQTIRPAADVRVSELTAAGLSRSDLRDGALALAGKTWRIESTLPKPSPDGEANGELRLVLIEV